MPQPVRRLELDVVALGLSDQGARQRRRHGNQPLLDVGLELADDLIGNVVAAVFVGQFDGRAENDLAVRRQSADVDHFGIAQRRFQFFDASLGETLLVTRGVIFGVLFKIAVRSRLRDSSDNARTFDAFQAFQFRAQALVALRCHRGTFHAVNSLCRSCRLFTAPPPRKSSECSNARAPAMVVEYVMRCCNASRRIEKESAMACLPSVVLTMKTISPFLIRSTTCGRPSSTLLMRSQTMPCSVRYAQVPDVATMLKPRAIKSFA